MEKKKEKRADNRSCWPVAPVRHAPLSGFVISIHPSIPLLLLLQHHCAGRTYWLPWRRDTPRASQVQVAPAAHQVAPNGGASALIDVDSLAASSSRIARRPAIDSRSVVGWRQQSATALLWPAAAAAVARLPRAASDNTRLIVLPGASRVSPVRLLLLLARKIYIAGRRHLRKKHRRP